MEKGKGLGAGAGLSRTGSVETPAYGPWAATSEQEWSRIRRSNDLHLASLGRPPVVNIPVGGPTPSREELERMKSDKHQHTQRILKAKGSEWSEKGGSNLSTGKGMGAAKGDEKGKSKGKAGSECFGKGKMEEKGNWKGKLGKQPFGKGDVKGSKGQDIISHGTGANCKGVAKGSGKENVHKGSGVAKGGGKYDSGKGAEGASAGARKGVAKGGKEDSVNQGKGAEQGVSAGAHKGVAKGGGKEDSINQGKGAEEGVSAGACKGVAKGGKEDSVNQGKGAEQGVSAGACKGVAKGGGKHDSINQGKGAEGASAGARKGVAKGGKEDSVNQLGKGAEQGVSASAHKGVAKGSGKEVSINQGKGAEEGVSAGACKGVAKGCGKDPRAGDVWKGKGWNWAASKGSVPKGARKDCTAGDVGMAGNGKGCGKESAGKDDGKAGEDEKHDLLLQKFTTLSDKEMADMIEDAKKHTCFPQYVEMRQSECGDDAWSFDECEMPDELVSWVLFRDRAHALTQPTCTGGKGNEKGGSFVPCKEEQDWSAQITGLLGFLICLRGTNIYSKGTNLDIKCGVIISR